MKFIKNNKVFILLLILTYVIFNIKLPYYIDGPGGLININNRYYIDNPYKISGSINMTYVSEYRANIASFLFAKINKDYDIYKKDNMIPSNETEKEGYIRGEIMLNEAIDDAIIVAFTKAEKEYTIEKQSLVITYISEDAITNLKIGDEIISIDGINVNSREEVYNIIKNHEIKDKIKIKVNNNDKEYNRYAYLQENKTIGILLSYKRKITTNPKLNIKLKNDEYGPSGGLMTSLAIYNQLVEKDITNGYKIAGTGTIDSDGKVGEIAGIKYKLKGAIKNKAKIFLCPAGNNYKEAIKLKNKYNYKIKIIKVETFEDAIKYLNQSKKE